MTLDKDKIKKALDDFEEDNYTQSKKELGSEIRNKINDYLKDRLDLEDNPIDDVEDNSEEDDEYEYDYDEE